MARGITKGQTYHRASQPCALVWRAREIMYLASRLLAHGCCCISGAHKLGLLSPPQPASRQLALGLSSSREAAARLQVPPPPLYVECCSGRAHTSPWVVRTYAQYKPLSSARPTNQVSQSACLGLTLCAILIV